MKEMTGGNMKIYKISFEHERIKIGGVYWFEYHCFESDESADAHLWYRSHQQVKVLSLGDCEVLADTEIEREEEGCPVTFKVEFQDGTIGEVFEDELFITKDGWYRPEPPKKDK